MRTLFFLLLAACSSEYYIQNQPWEPSEDSCVATNQYTACRIMMPYEVASEFCEESGFGRIAEVADLADQQHLALIGVREFGTDIPWWTTHNTYPYECPVMNQYGSTSPANCNEFRPFICEL